MKGKLWCERMAAWACVVLVSACSSTPKKPPAVVGATSGAEKALQKVWVAEGFKFAGYDTLYVAETGATIAPTREQTQPFDLDKRLVREEFAAAMQEKRLFQHVVTRESDILPGARVLKLETAITEFGKIDGDRPVITVAGKLLDQERPVLQFEARRGAGFRAWRALGLYKRSKEIKAEDIRSMAKALAEFIRRKITANG